MELYLVERLDQFGYDEFDSFVVAALDEEEAMKTHPFREEWDGISQPYGSWTTSDKVLVTHLGQATENKYENRTVLIASFNAG